MDDSEPEGIDRKEHIDHIEILFCDLSFAQRYLHRWRYAPSLLSPETGRCKRGTFRFFGCGSARARLCVVNQKVFWR